MLSQIPYICKKLYQKNLIAGSDGNVSEKRGDKVFISPRGKNKSELKEEDISCLNLKGQTLKGHPSTEKQMHLSIYQYQKKAKAIIHAHPIHAVALSLVRPQWKELPPALPEIIVALGSVPFVAYTMPGTKELGESLKKFVQHSQALILSHHGAVVWGENLEEAYLRMEQLEHSCKILCVSEAMGNINLLTKGEVTKLFKTKLQEE